MHYTNVALSIFALCCLFKWTDAKRMSEEEARRKLYTLAELLDAEISTRQELNSILAQQQANELEMVQEPEKLIGKSVENAEIAVDAVKTPRQFSLDNLLQEFPSPANKRSNLLKLANQSARGFGK
ncbi:hypothetical protein M3Y98_00019000 [Aphelenchoides besseyi]|nr:hypothetical protein M3Y98_00019000 [Aphelenchoides besseyi]KAI6199233.1 hypothetical protein M3Y96_00604900 [Aphelenchoides besseyi]